MAIEDSGAQDADTGRGLRGVIDRHDRGGFVMIRFPSVTVRFGVLVAIVASVGVLTACTPPVATQLTRRPYLTDLVGTSVEVNWATDRSNMVASTSWGAVDVGWVHADQRRGRGAHEHHGRHHPGVPVAGHADAARLGPVLLPGGPRLGRPARWRCRRPTSPPRCPAGARHLLVRGVRRLGPDRLGRRQPRHHPADGADRRLGRALRGERRRQRLPVGQPDQQRRPQAARGQDTSVIFGPAFWTVGGQSPCRCSSRRGTTGSAPGPRRAAPSRSTGPRTRRWRRRAAGPCARRTAV